MVANQDRAASRVKLRFLGGCEVGGPGGPIRLESAKTMALLAYLAIQGTPQTRQKLMGFLWADLPEKNAARNLRHALWNLKKSLAPSGTECIRTTHQAVAFEPVSGIWLDTAEFRRACENLGERSPHAAIEMESLGAAVELYRGDLLDGFYADGAPAFEEWLLIQRERFRAMALTALQRLAILHRQRGDYGAGLLFARRMLALDPWREEAHRVVMDLLARAGHRSTALAQYETCRQVLAEEFHAEPTAETTALYETILGSAKGTISAPAPGKKGSKSLSAIPAHNLPLPPTPFVGREEELARIAGLFLNPDCRLLTLVGPGGIGKTRLAVQAALQTVVPEASVKSLFPDGVYFVPLAEIPSTAFLVPAVSAVLPFSFQGPQDTKTQLLDFLREKRTLLILDNFELLLPAVAFLSEILRAAPEVKLLATSRERLKLKEEWALELGGLVIPGEGEEGDPNRDSALRLFLQCARRADLGFVLKKEDIPDLTRTCRLVDGMPLGIELAAGWVRTLSLAEIPLEIEQNLDFLSASSVEVPARQRSLRAVFDRTWRILNEEEQSAFAALSVFRGGFTRDAAQAVAGASLCTLSGLLDRSLLRRSPSGRFHLHPVLGQYGREVLDRSPAQKMAVHDRHGALYAAFLRNREEFLWGPSQKQAMAQIREEIANVRAAWEWAVAGERIEDLQAALDGFVAIHHINGWFEDCELALAEATRTLRAASIGGAATESVLSRLAIARGRMLNRLGRFAEAHGLLGGALSLLRSERRHRFLAETLLRDGEALVGLSEYGHALTSLTESLALARGEGANRLAAEALGLLSRLHRETGDYAAAGILIEEGLGLARPAGDHSLLSSLLFQESYIALNKGDLQSTQRCRQESLEIARADGDQASAADALSGLGVVAFFMKDFEKAQDYLEESLAICRQTGYRHGMGRAMGNLAENARWRGDYQEAIRWGLLAMEMNRSIGNRLNMGTGLVNLGYACIAAGDERAKHFLREALKTSAIIGAPSLALYVLIGFAHLAARRGETDEALELLGLAVSHPASNDDTKRDAQVPLAELRSTQGEEAVEAGLARGYGLDMDLVVRRLLANPNN